MSTDVVICPDCKERVLDPEGHFKHHNLCINCGIFLWMFKRHFVLGTDCAECGNRLVPIGSARANGKEHGDWDSRMLHKQCWVALQRQFR